MAYRNPKTNRPIKFGTRVFYKLLQEGYTEEQLRENQPAHLQINNDVLPHHYIVNDNFNGYGIEYIKHLRLVIDPQMLLHDENNEIRNVIRNYIIEHDVIKFSIILNVTFVKPENQNKLTLHINSEYKILNRGDNINDFISDSAAEIVNKISEKELEGSGFIIENINFIKIKLFEHIPAYEASSYFPTPNYLCSKSVINVQNTDNKCFMWAILSALHPAPNNPHRVSNYKPYENELNFENITFPECYIGHSRSVLDLSLIYIDYHDQYWILSTQYLLLLVYFWLLACHDHLYGHYNSSYKMYILDYYYIS